MKFKSLAILSVLIGMLNNLSIAANSVHFRHRPTLVAAYWSITPKSSVYDSLKIVVKKSSLSDNSDALKEYINALQFRQQLEASDIPLPPYPISAGVFNGSLVSDSLSADDQILFLYRNLGDRKAEAGVLSSLGTRAAMNGDMDKALRYFHEALSLNTEIDDKAGIIKNQFSLARIYKYKGDLDEAVNYNRNIVQAALQSRNNRSLAEAYMNLAKLWLQQKKFSQAESLIMDKALALNCYKLHDKVGAMRCYDLLAEIYQQQNRFSEAKWFYIQSNMVARKIDNSSGVVNSLVNLGHVKMSIGDHQLALQDLREAEQLSISNNYSYKLVEIKNDLSKVYTMMGNTSAASSALSEFVALKDALLNTVQ